MKEPLIKVDIVTGENVMSGSPDDQTNSKKHKEVPTEEETEVKSVSEVRNVGDLSDEREVSKEIKTGNISEGREVSKGTNERFTSRVQGTSKFF